MGIRMQVFLGLRWRTPGGPRAGCVCLSFCVRVRERVRERVRVRVRA